MVIFKFARGLSRLVNSLPNGKMLLKQASFGALAAVLLFYFQCSVILSLLVVFNVYLATGGWRFMKVAIKTFPRDARGALYLVKSLRIMKHLQKSNATVATLFQETVQRHPNKLAFIMVDGKEWTFKEVDEKSNAIANYLHQEGFKPGDVIAIFMESCPEFVCLWLGMAKIGIHAALLNFNLRNEALAHCINASHAKAVIYAANLSQDVKDMNHLLPGDIQMFCYGDSEPDVLLSTPIEKKIDNCCTILPPAYSGKFNGKLFYIYTSGTTGLPKAAIVINSRYFYMAASTHHFFKMNGDDVIYDTLPVYHSAGGILGIGQALIKGCTVVIRKKFSASRFWDDCIKYNVTVVQYIGEICRYLLAQPDKLSDRQHRVRVAFGNGLRPQIWEQFQKRFSVERIGEFYGATEGNANIINIDNTVGAVGFCTRIAPFLFPVCLIRVDEVTGQPIRDRHGLCIRCEPGEPGELVGKIIKGDPLREFDGYVNKDATSKKVAQNVFSKGDSAFMTGDILVMDDLGYMYFKDRTGDTFRWKGENVSTAEVEATVSNIVKLNDAVCYGVEVPGAEGRAGMVAIVDEQDTVDLQSLYKELQKALPPYARPVFVRCLKNVEMTGTFKLKKTNYRKDGYDPSKVEGDKIYYLDARGGQFKPIDQDVYNDIMKGKIKL